MPLRPYIRMNLTDNAGIMFGLRYEQSGLISGQYIF